MKNWAERLTSLSSMWKKNGNNTTTRNSQPATRNSQPVTRNPQLEHGKSHKRAVLPGPGYGIDILGSHPGEQVLLYLSIRV